MTLLVCATFTLILISEARLKENEGNATACVSLYVISILRVGGRIREKTRYISKRERGKKRKETKNERRVVLIRA